MRYITNAAYRQQKASLTRAENSGDPLRVLASVEKTLDEWEGRVYPDDWHRWNIALHDALQQYQRGYEPGVYSDRGTANYERNIDRFLACCGDLS